MQQKVFALVGFPGSGKTLASKFFQKKGFVYVRMGDVTDKMLDEEKRKRNEKNEKQIREDIRKKYGSDIYAILVFPKIESGLKGNLPVVIDGLRCLSEFDYFTKRISGLKIIYIDTKSKIRQERLILRKSRSLNIEEFKLREKDEKEFFDTGKFKQIADYVIINNGNMQALYEKLEKIK